MEGPAELVKGRVSYVVIAHPRFGQVYLCNVYAPQGGRGMAAGMYGKMGENVDAHRKPVLIGGDHNTQPREFKAMLKEYVHKGAGSLLVVDTGLVTCGAEEEGSNIDYFIEDSLLAQVLEQPKLVEVHTARMHKPVTIKWVHVRLDDTVQVYKQPDWRPQTDLPDLCHIQGRSGRCDEQRRSVHR